MRNSIISSCIFILIFSVSCTKEGSLKKDDGLIKIIDSIVMDTHIGSIQLEDDNFLIVSKSQMVKFNNEGKILWEKNVSPYNLYLRNVISVPGTGFASIGLTTNLSVMNVCVYDNDGNFLFLKSFNTNQPNAYGIGITEFIKLSNGNYAVSYYSNFSNCSFLHILDNDFNHIYSRAFIEPPNYQNLTIQRISGTSDGGVAIAASIGGGDLTHNFINTAILVTEPNGIAKSFTVLNDTLINEVPSVVTPYNNGFFAVTSKMIGWETGNGAFVDYYGLSLIAGQIGFDLFDHNGQFTGRTVLNDYPGYGAINSIRKTADGGFILCGTVNNLGTSIAISKTKIYLCKVDANLNKQWSKVIQSTYQTIGVDAVPTSDGGYQITGNVKSFDVTDKMILIKTDSNGNF